MPLVQSGFDFMSPSSHFLVVWALSPAIWLRPPGTSTPMVSVREIFQPTCVVQYIRLSTPKRVVHAVAPAEILEDESHAVVGWSKKDVRSDKGDTRTPCNQFVFRISCKSNALSNKPRDRVFQQQNVLQQQRIPNFCTTKGPYASSSVSSAASAISIVGTGVY